MFRAPVPKPDKAKDEKPLKQDKQALTAYLEARGFDKQTAKALSKEDDALATWEKIADDLAAELSKLPKAAPKVVPLEVKDKVKDGR